MTYEPTRRHLQRPDPGSTTNGTAFARCYWYQVGKRTDPQADTLIPGSTALPVDGPDAHLAGPGQDAADGPRRPPVHVNVALVMPSVINVFPRAFEVH